MLTSLSITNIVLIDELFIDFKEGLCVLTGETGAGKSILLDALGLALGARAEPRLIRQGADKAQVSASFILPSDHLLWRELDEQGIAYEDGEVIFRRLLEANGKSKCFLNDQLISQALIRRLGQELVEIHGQFDQLLDSKSHLAALDAYGKIEKSPVQEAFLMYQEAKGALRTFQENLNKSLERQTFLRFAIEEIEKAEPRSGEEEELESERSLIAHQAKIAETLLGVDQSLSAALSGLSQTHKGLMRIQDLLPEKITPLIEAADRAMMEGQEVYEGTKALKGEVEGTRYNLETLENRLYALRTLSRKYQTEDLVSYLKELKKEFSNLEQGEDYLSTLNAAVEAAKIVYVERA